MKTYRSKTDGSLVRAHQKRNGDWLVQTEVGGSFHCMNDWYFSRTYELVGD